MTPREIAKLPLTYYVGDGPEKGWHPKCPCGARETGERHPWHDPGCHRHGGAR